MRSSKVKEDSCWLRFPLIPKNVPMIDLTGKMLLLLMILFLNSCLPNLRQSFFIQPPNDFTWPKEGWEKSFYNDGYTRGQDLGYEKGYSNGYIAGDQDGYQRGLIEGRRMAENALLDSLKAAQASDDLRLRLINGMYSNKDTLDKFEGIREAGFVAGLHAGRKEAYIQAYRTGFEDAFDSLYPINLRRGQGVKYQIYDPNKMNLSIPYERIARFMAKELQKESYLNKKAFDQLLKEVHIGFINMVSQMVELDGQEDADMFLRYEEMHTALSELYYETYLQKLILKNRDLDKNFYDYRYHLSCVEFVYVVRTGICSLMDVLITYAKNNSQSATLDGFEVMGHICELLHREPIQEFEDGLLKSALVFDYDANVDRLTTSLRNLLAKQTVEILPRVIDSKSVYLDEPDFGVDIERDIIQVLAIGFDTTQVLVAVDHNEQKFYIKLSDRPVVLRQLFELGIPTYIRAETLCPASSPSATKSLKLDSSQWAKEDYTVLTKSHQAIPSITIGAVRNLVPFFKKFMESAIALPTSCYNVYLDFDGQAISLLETNCSHG